MHVGAVSIFEGAPFLDSSGRFRLAEVRRLVGSRLHLIPRFRKRLMFVPFEQGRPVWVDDPRFDIAYHVRLTALPHPGSREQLLALTARIQAQLLDRDRPLWELWFVEGLEGGNVGLIQKTHHALVDGVSGRRRRDRPARLHAGSHVPRAAALDRRTPAEPGPPLRRHALRAHHRARRDRAHGPSHRPHPATHVRAYGSARPRALHARRPQLDRAAHVDQRRGGSSPAVRRRAGLARRREGDSQGARRHRERRRARRSRGRAARAVRVARRRPHRPAPACAVSGVGPGRLRAHAARQPRVGHVRGAPGRRVRPGRSASGRSGPPRST